MIPGDVMGECRQKGQDAMAGGKPTNWFAAGVIIAVSLLLATLSVVLVVRFLRD